tara:strand:- start:53 stop:304 length:252 start_codon:yes stop_codon:yes gene_type:complete
MILYDYVCESCDIKKEELVKNRDVEVPCPECGVTMRRLFPCPSISTLNSPEKVSNALKRRSEAHSKKTREESIYNAFIGRKKK